MRFLRVFGEYLDSLVDLLDPLQSYTWGQVVWAFVQVSAWYLKAYPGGFGEFKADVDVAWNRYLEWRDWKNPDPFVSEDE